MPRSVRRSVIAALPDPPTRNTLAVDVAAAEAAARGRPLRLVRTRVPSSDRDVAGPRASRPDTTVESVLRRVADAHPDLAVGIAVSTGDPAAIMIDEARRAALVVVGHEDGSDACMAAEVASGAGCPVIVIPEGAREAPAAGLGPVLVGVGGERDGPAVTFGLREASLHHVPLQVMHVWRSIPDMEMVSLDPFVYSTAEARRDAEQLIEAVLNGRPDLYPGVPVRRVPFCHVDVPATLGDASAEASLLVLGPPRRSGSGRRRLGRVGRRLIGGARCPVAFMPAT